MRPWLTWLAAGSWLFAGAAVGAENGKIAVELNDLQQADGGCRAVFVLNNGLGKALDKVTFRVVTFDAKQHGHVLARIEHSAFHGGHRYADQFADFDDRFFAQIEQIDDFAMRSRQSVQASLQPAARLLAIERRFRLQWEEVQNAHVLLYPEGMIKLNGSAGEILKRCDGKATIAEITLDLERAFATSGLAGEVIGFVALAVKNQWLTVQP